MLYETQFQCQYTGWLKIKKYVNIFKYVKKISKICSMQTLMKIKVA